MRGLGVGHQLVAAAVAHLDEPERILEQRAPDRDEIEVSAFVAADQLVEGGGFGDLVLEDAGDRIVPFARTVVGRPRPSPFQRENRTRRSSISLRFTLTLAAPGCTLTW